MCLIPCGINKEYNLKGETKKTAMLTLLIFMSDLNFKEKFIVANSALVFCFD